VQTYEQVGGRAGCCASSIAAKCSAAIEHVSLLRFLSWACACAAVLVDVYAHVVKCISALFGFVAAACLLLL